jgi:REP element-mobilizing transposase RayT
MDIHTNKRQGQMDFFQTYFYTETIYGFKNLLADDNIKAKVIDSWKYLVDASKVKIYGFVIMPNHIHLIWDLLNTNSKESPAASFAKFTAHRFKKYLQVHNISVLEEYKSNKVDRLFQFWKRGPLAIPLTSEKSFIQKLDYMHSNPLQQKWQLVDIPEDYKWSSARFYETGVDEFEIITDYRD